MTLSNLREDLDSEDREERLGLAIRELERVASLLTNLVEESRQAPERPRRLDLGEVLDELARLVRYQLGEQVVLELEAPRGLHSRLPEGALRYAVLNLVLNAAQALGDTGGAIRVTLARRDGLAEVAVSDDGPGFPAELLRIGVHDFGSWRRGGTGIGLAMVHRFARDHGGRLELGNVPGAGARAALLLPLGQD
jgi:signal transduction histidine kinase